MGEGQQVSLQIASALAAFALFAVRAAAFCALLRQRGHLPALKNFGGHQALEFFQIRHVLVKRHVAHAQRAGHAGEGKGGQADLHAGFGNAFAGQGAGAAPRGGWRLVAHGMPSLLGHAAAAWRGGLSTAA